MEFLNEPTPYFWYIVAITLILLEVLAAPGFGLLFAGLGAITLGGVVTFGIMEIDGWLAQIAYFFFFTTVWWVVLWKPLKNAIRKEGPDTFEDVVGTQCEVDEEGGIKHGEIGHVKWSGTRMRARLSPASEASVLAIGQKAWVHDKKDGILYIDVNEPEHPSIKDEK